MRAVVQAEALANAIGGIVLSQTLLWIFGIEFKEAIALNAAMQIVSYARSYTLRRLFSTFETSRTTFGKPHTGRRFLNGKDNTGDEINRNGCGSKCRDRRGSPRP